jgi:hypothetical protein
MVKREVFDAIGLFNETCRHASDYELWLKVARRFPFDYVDEPLVKYRKGHANLTSQSDRQLSHALNIMNEFVKNYPNEIPGPELRAAYAETYLHMAQALRKESKLRSLSWLMRSIAAWPFCGEAWRDLSTFCLPEGMKAFFRRFLRSARMPSP